ncbi:MAG TPA: hypothetical protein VMW69_01515 [Spirochaetia bacterium]|nr:hypothetical protein [Spirochaetia bacterium]
MSEEIEIVKVGDRGGLPEKEFIRLPFGIYAGCSEWVPWFNTDVRALVRGRHPFSNHNDGAFFVARCGGVPRGRIAVFENRSYNETHNLRHAQFYFLDLYDDDEVAAALFETAFAWARGRGLEALTGPLGFGAVSGGGLLIEGFEHRSAMTMMAYNFPYYPQMLERLGFETYLDLYSYHLDSARFTLPDRVRSVAEKVLKRGSFRVMEFKSKAEIRAIAGEIGRVYNQSLSDHPENYEMTQEELDRVTKDLMLTADPSLIKILTYRDKIAGFLFGFPDLSAALQRAKGRINPLTLIDILGEFKRTRSLIINGAGILPEYQRLGGNALLYYELERTIHADGRFADADLTQIAQTTGMMLSDIDNIGGAERYKIHRIYTRRL